MQIAVALIVTVASKLWADFKLCGDTTSQLPASYTSNTTSVTCVLNRIARVRVDDVQEVRVNANVSGATLITTTGEGEGDGVID